MVAADFGECSGMWVMGLMSAPWGPQSIQDATSDLRAGGVHPTPASAAALGGGRLASL